MQRITINTPYNVNLEYIQAGIALRMLAYLLDLLILSTSIIPIMIVLSLLEKHLMLGDLIYVIYLLIFTPYLLYNLIMDKFFSGQTLGKKIVKIKVISLDGNNLTFLQCFLRWVLRTIDIHLTSGCAAVYSVVFTEKAQRIGDIAAGTTVVKIEKSEKMKNFIYRETAEIDPVYPEVEDFDENTISILQEVIEYVKKAGNTKASIETQEKVLSMIEEKYGLTPNRILSSSQKSNSKSLHLPFFETLICDFNIVNKRL